MLLYAPGILLYKWALKENNIQKQDTKLEKTLMLIIVVLGVVALVGLITGKISIEREYSNRNTANFH